MADIKLTKDINDVLRRRDELRAKDYMHNPLAEALRINYLVHVQLLLDIIAKRSAE